MNWDQEKIDAFVNEKMGTTGKTVVSQSNVVVHEDDDAEVDLPPGFRMISVRDKDGDKFSRHDYAVIDLSSMGVV